MEPPHPKSMLNDNIYEFDRWVRYGSGHNLMIPKAIHRVFLSPKGRTVENDSAASTARNQGPQAIGYIPW